MPKKNTEEVEKIAENAPTAEQPEAPAEVATPAEEAPFTYAPIVALEEVLTFLNSIQETPERCDNNACAISHIETAIGWIDRSQARRAAEAKAKAKV